MECLYILKQYFRYYSVSIPDIDDLSKKVHSCIDTSIFTVVFMQLDFQ